MLQEGEIIFVQDYWLVFVLVVSLNLGVLLFVRYRMKREMSTQMNSSVNAAVESYFALSGTD